MFLKSFYSILLVLSVNVFIVKSWELAVTLEGQIEFYSSNGTRVNVAAQQFTKPSALTLDDVTDQLFFSDPGHDNSTIFSLQLQNQHEIKHLVRKTEKDNVQGIAFDPVTQILYWTNGMGKTIFYYSLVDDDKTNGNGYGKVLLTFEKKIPHGIVVDICRRTLYWTNANHQSPSIERSSLDGADHEVLITDDLFVPLGLAIDQANQRIYWADDKEGIYYRIESADLDGKNRQILYHGRDHEPYNLAVGKDYIYWTDWVHSAIWMIPKTAPNGSDIVPRKLHENFNKQPMGVVAKQELQEVYTSNPHCKMVAEIIAKRSEGIQSVDVPTDVPLSPEVFCLNGGDLVKPETCVCKTGFLGKQCETSSCHNYCLNGTCRLSSAGYPQCTCPAGYGGSRCETDFCAGFCMNNGRCIVENTDPVCFCPMPYAGRRCEAKATRAAVCAEYCKTGLMYASGENSDTANCRCTKNGGYISEESGESVPDNTNATSESLLFEEALPISDCLTENAHNPFVMALAAASGILLCTTVMLGHKIYKVTRRPRIRKRIIVNKNITPLTCPPPVLATQQCEITIENCCNMNICETPCFDPVSYRDPREEKVSKKEEKKNLLSSMENGDDLY